VLFTPEFQESCLANLFSLKVSVIDSDAKRYADFHGTNEGQWKRVVDNMEYAANLKSKNNLDCTIHTTIYAEDSSYQDLKSMVEFCKNIGFNLVTISKAIYSERTPTPNLTMKTECHDESFLKDLSREIQSLEDDLFEVNIALLDKGGICSVDDKDKDECTSDAYRFVDETKKINCQGIHFSTIIDANGFVYPCWRYWNNTEYAYGNLMEQSFDEIWRSPRRQEINKKMETEYYSKKTCSVCSHSRINEQLLQIEEDNSWANFLT
jgi:cyclic pyranopterin phosphate synthase